MTALSRRDVMGGALVLGFSTACAGPATAQGAQAALPGSLKTTPLLDSWIRLDAEGAVTVATGKAELGQGIRTALLQIAAEELRVPLASIRLITADTASTANEGYTSGSHSMKDSGTAIRHAAAQVREMLVAAAADRLGLPAPQLEARDGAVWAPGGQSVAYAGLVTAAALHTNAAPQSRLTDRPSIMGQSVSRVDIPAKVTGGAAYVHDLRLPGMVHARLVRPSGPGAQLTALDTAAVARMPGVIEVVRDGNFLAVVAQREFQAIQAMQALSAAAQWAPGPALPNPDTIIANLRLLPSQDTAIVDRRTPAQGQVVKAQYTRQYQAHGSISPSCAVARFADGAMTVWTHTQGVFPDRGAIAEMLRLPPDRVRLIHMEGSGCYGHNGADDAAADAALIARALPGRPVRVQWTREQEHVWEPFGPAMATEVQASLDATGAIADWDYAVWSNTHSTRPGPAGALLAARLLAQPFPEPKPIAIPQPEGGGDRNAIPLYNFASMRVMHHFIPHMPLRVSAMRSLGAYMNVFSIESFVDELALTAGADPVAYRLRHLQQERARDVVALAAEKFGWVAGQAAPPGRGYGFAFAQYKNLAAYCAIATEVEVDRKTGRTRLVRAVAAVDSGQAVNPDGIRNQIEGAILQSMSWTLIEAVPFTEAGVTGTDWASYPILRMNGLPDRIDVHIIDRPGQPFLGTGEAGQGPTAAALGNAIAQATGKRLRDLPLTPEKLRAALAV